MGPPRFPAHGCCPHPGQRLALTRSFVNTCRTRGSLYTSARDRCGDIRQHPRFWSILGCGRAGVLSLGCESRGRIQVSSVRKTASGTELRGLPATAFFLFFPVDGSSRVMVCCVGPRLSRPFKLGITHVTLFPFFKKLCFKFF